MPLPAQTIINLQATGRVAYQSRFARGDYPRRYAPGSAEYRIIDQAWLAAQSKAEAEHARRPR